jgi:hypothetical protein
MFMHRSFHGFYSFSVHKYIDWCGLCPLRADETGKYSEINWSDLGGTFDYLIQWNRMMKKEVRGDLHCPVLILPQRHGEQGIFIWLRRWRSADNLELCGGFHGIVPQQISPLQVKLNVKVSFTKIDGNVLTIHQHGNVNIQHGYPGKLLLTFRDVPWSQLNDSIPPTANISIQ